MIVSHAYGFGFGYDFGLWTKSPPKAVKWPPIPSESALVASLQVRLFHWMTFSTGANTHPEKALLDWFAEDAIATTRLRKCTLSAASPATIFLLYSIQIQ